MQDTILLMGDIIQEYLLLPAYPVMYFGMEPGFKLTISFKPSKPTIMLKSFFTWAAGILEDQSGTASSKRVGFYWAFSLLSYMIYKDINGAKVSSEMFYAVFTIILVGYGLITSEFFKGKQFPTGKPD